MANTTEGKVYITALSSLDKLEIQFIPAQLNITRSPSIASIAVVGRNNPLHHYTGGSTSMKFELDFYAEQADRTDVVEKCKWLESLAYSNGFDNPPERVRLTFGELFRNNEVWIVESVSVRYVQFDAVFGLLPTQAYVSLSLKLDPESNLKINEIRWT